MAIPMSLVIGGPLSGLLMGMHNPLAMEGWRWMFLVEGLPAIFCAFLAAWYLPTSPEAASWLNARERAWITQELCSEHQGKEASGVSPWSVLGDRATWLCTGLWFGVLAGNYGVIFWLPQALHGLSGLSTLEIGLVVALPGSPMCWASISPHAIRTTRASAISIWPFPASSPLPRWSAPCSRVRRHWVWCC
jgi:ACS family tartrate transporter-like MFS transporter